MPKEEKLQKSYKKLPTVLTNLSNKVARSALLFKDIIPTPVFYTIISLNSKVRPRKALTKPPDLQKRTIDESMLLKNGINHDIFFEQLQAIAGLNSKSEKQDQKASYKPKPIHPPKPKLRNQRNQRKR